MPQFDSPLTVPDSAAAKQAADHLDGLSSDAQGLVNFHTRGLLGIELPVSVTLATTRKPIGQIVRLGSGAILPLNKSCEEELDLYVGDKWFARGEVVQVGDRFGLRITSIVRPEQRLAAAGRSSCRRRAA
jgi:flagellar motor switch protein FliN/FliY